MSQCRILLLIADKISSTIPITLLNRSVLSAIPKSNLQGLSAGKLCPRGHRNPSVILTQSSLAQAIGGFASAYLVQQLIAQHQVKRYITCGGYVLWNPHSS